MTALARDLPGKELSDVVLNSSISRTRRAADIAPTKISSVYEGGLADRYR